MDLLLIPSPLLGPATWAPVAAWLHGQGHAAGVAAYVGEALGPEAVVASVASAAARLNARAGLVIVPHSNAGLYAPMLGDLLEVRATVYVDAALAGAGPDTVLAPDAFADFLADLADPDGLLPPWTEWWDDVDYLFPDPATRAAVEAEQRRLPLAYFQQRLPVPAGWSGRPNAYLAFGDTYADERAFARAYGWPTATLAGDHVHQLHRPDQVGREVLRLLAEVTC